VHVAVVAPLAVDQERRTLREGTPRAIVDIALAIAELG
jgi:hypothetical protein